MGRVVFPAVATFLQTLEELERDPHFERWPTRVLTFLVRCSQPKARSRTLEPHHRPRTRIRRSSNMSRPLKPFPNLSPPRPYPGFEW